MKTILALIVSNVAGVLWIFSYPQITAYYNNIISRTYEIPHHLFYIIISLFIFLSLILLISTIMTLISEKYQIIQIINAIFLTIHLVLLFTNDKSLPYYSIMLSSTYLFLIILSGILKHRAPHKNEDFQKD